MEIYKAIQSLKPNVSFSMTGDDIVTWESDLAQPTTSEINAEIIVLQAAYDALEYSRLRKAKYDLLNQDEMRYDDLINNTTTWRDGIAAIKVAHPKP